MRVLQRSAPLLSLTICLFILAIAGCASNSTSAEAMLGPSGGSLALTAEGIRLDVPAGALAQNTAVVLTATVSTGVLVVGIQPTDLVLAQQATLGIQFQGPVHVSDVSEVRGSTSFPVGVDVRIETPAGAQLRMRLDHFAQIRVATETGTSDGGTKTCCGEDCEEHRDGGMQDADSWGGGDDGEHSDGGFCSDESDGEHADGGVCDNGNGGEPTDGGPGDDDHRDGGVIASGSCPSGFDCDDGVCVSPGGNDEENQDNVCGGDEDGDGEADGGQADGGTSASCPAGTHCSDGRCRPNETSDGGDD